MRGSPVSRYTHNTLEAARWRCKLDGRETSTAYQLNDRLDEASTHSVWPHMPPSHKRPTSEEAGRADNGPRRPVRQPLLATVGSAATHVIRLLLHDDHDPS
jgi:hypothetical protein